MARGELRRWARSLTLRCSLRRTRMLRGGMQVGGRARMVQWELRRGAQRGAYDDRVVFRRQGLGFVAAAVAVAARTLLEAGQFWLRRAVA